MITSYLYACKKKEEEERKEDEVEKKKNFQYTHDNIHGRETHISCANSNVGPRVRARPFPVYSFVCFSAAEMSFSFLFFCNIS